VRRAAQDKKARIGVFSFALGALAFLRAPKARVPSSLFEMRLNININFLFLHVF
jgi:hypothetical protein